MLTQKHREWFILVCTQLTGTYRLWPCFLWLSPFIPRPEKDRTQASHREASCPATPWRWTIYERDGPGTSVLSWHHLDPWHTRIPTVAIITLKRYVQNSIFLAGCRLKERAGAKQQPLIFISITLFTWSDLWYYWLTGIVCTSSADRQITFDTLEEFNSFIHVYIYTRTHIYTYIYTHTLSILQSMYIFICI